MKLLFPCHPLQRTQPDPDYESEVTAAQRAGFECEFYDLEVLREGEATRSLARCPKSSSPGQLILHCGWMMSDTIYSQLHAELLEKGYVPITPPEQYAEVHYLPNAYPKLLGLTPSWATSFLCQLGRTPFQVIGGTVETACRCLN